MLDEVDKIKNDIDVDIQQALEQYEADKKAKEQKVAETQRLVEADRMKTYEEVKAQIENGELKP